MGFWVLIVVILLVVSVGVLVVSALIAKDRLESVVPLTKQLQSQLVDGDNAAASDTALEIQGKTGDAVGWVQHPIWRAAEAVPVLGANFNAVRVATEAADLLADDAIVPASGLDVEALKPVKRVFNVPAIRDMAPTVVAIDDAVKSAADSMRDIDRVPLLGLVGDAVDQLQATLDGARGLTQVMSAAVQVLPDALDGDSPRHYLMVFQNNAEVRATGGNPASLLLMSMTKGEIAIERQSSSANFPAKRSPIIALEAESKAILGNELGTRLLNSTMTPEFPESAALIQAWWADRYGQQVDGVLSFDPVALSYLVKASLPISLPSGELLDANTTVPLLLSEIYQRYPVPADQDAIFAAVASEVFDQIASGESPLTGLMPQLARAADERRMLLWSSRPEEQALLAGTKLVGTLPSDNLDATTVGVYLNDRTKYKMSYYLDAAIDAACSADGAVTLDTTLTSSAPVGGAGLADYVVGPSKGIVSTDILVFGPIGATLDAVTIDGESVDPVVAGAVKGRPVARLTVALEPGGSATIGAEFSGATGELGALDVRTTPMVRATPVDVARSSTCG